MREQEPSTTQSAGGRAGQVPEGAPTGGPHQRARGAIPMSHVTAMLDAYPKDLGSIDRQKLADWIHACFACGETWTAPTSAPPPARCCPGTPAMTPTSPGPSWRPAVSPAQAAPPNAKLTLT